MDKYTEKKSANEVVFKSKINYGLGQPHQSNTRDSIQWKHHSVLAVGFLLPKYLGFGSLASSGFPF